MSDTVERKKASKKTKKRKKIWKSILKGVLICFAVIILLGAGAGVYINVKYGSQIKQSIADGNKIAQGITLASFDTREPTQFYDTNGKLLSQYNTNNYDYTKASDLNPYVFKAFVAVEDSRFYQDGAIDYRGTLRALLADLKSGGQAVEGGSTITQQLARNVFLTFNKSIWRKIEEAVIAEHIEKDFTKNQILEFYVNNINYANGCYSIESASEYYFQKDTKQLDLSQIAFLVGIPNDPSYYNPVYHMDHTLQRRNLILQKMLNLGYISQAQYTEAKNETIKLDLKSSQAQPMNYAIEYAVYNATRDLMANDGFVFRDSFTSDQDRKNYFSQYNTQYAEEEKDLLSGGYNVYTSIDMTKQNKLQEIVDRNLSGYTARDPKTGLYEKQAASVTIDNSTGEVVAIVGGRSQKGNDFNRAFLAVRQPGSTIKPLIVYTPAFENGYLPSSTFVDAPIPNGPINDDHIYKGVVTLQYALDVSINTIPFRLVERDGVQASLDYLKKMGFEYIMPEDTSPIVAIGGFTEGVTPVEMASGYSAIARGGEFISPTNVRKIVDEKTGDVVYKDPHTQVRVYDSGAAYLMTKTLETVITEPYGTAHNLPLDDYPYVTGKTGTTNGSKDAWFIGYTPYYTTAVWVGDDLPKAQNMYGDTVPGRIWQTFMEYLHKGLPQKDFVEPNTVVEQNGVLMDTLYEEDQQNGTGVANSQESIYEKNATDAITALQNFNLTSTSQITQVNQLIQNANDALNNVENQDLYNAFKTTIQNLVNKIDQEENNLKNGSSAQTGGSPGSTGNPAGNNTGSSTNNGGQQNTTGGSQSQQNQGAGSNSSTGSSGSSTANSTTPGGSSTGTQQGQSTPNQ